MTITGTVEEINTVARTMNPEYPHQNLENAGLVCVYTIGGVHVTLHIEKEEKKCKKPKA